VPQRILVFDTETVTDGETVEPIELAFLEVDSDLSVLREYEILVKPALPIDPVSRAAHHIGEEEVANCPTMSEALARDFPADYFDGVLGVAHHIQFDAGVMAPWWNITEQLCTLRAARRFYPNAPAHKLQVLRYWLNLDIETGSAHRAMADVRVLYALLTEIAEESGCETLAELIAEVKKPLVIEHMPWGKHKGMELKQLPAGYVRWVLDKAENVDPDLRACLEAL
jgi:exodeoxyribonuclease X